MRELLRTTDPTVIAFATALLRGEGIEVFPLDHNMSILEGSIGILPRRLMVREEDLANAWELAGYFVAQSYRVYAEFKKENKDDLLAHALGQFLNKHGGEWEGTATELFNAIAKLGFTRALPKKPDALTQAVRKAARNSPTLTAEKGQRSAESRSIVLRREYPEGSPGGASGRA